MLPTVVLQTGPNPDATVIWLHGLGADGHDFEPIVPELGLPEGLHVRFVFPHAPSMPVSINGGYVMPAWYDIKHTDIGYEQDARGIIESARRIQLLIDREEMHGIRANRIVLAGFSQGGAMALHVGLRQGEPLAGVVALSSYLPLAERLDVEVQQATRVSKFFVGHGVHDPVVPFSLGDQTCRVLQQCGYDVQWHTYPMEHSVCREEIVHIGRFLTQVLQA
ncbi:MAG: carboxylesterase [Zetaproteobacteria bacterium CG_4_9_14_3_um_filter_49_83]|nr:MAG: carboxylesterase [Zetaproteobacteria bacterium CG1_02_49_23]PIV31103.1 MAG: carboxylesterase [Zetaproteobacteria bacterium CG02_land_8_20_14_3_00_50_9]PIY54585.1 MAG: carboxylesterase [Zetaproteobacteria bacterium CG_4_10_14_0_8_um_filter_49_80]PJA35686.1 MAG: carboxylesterase [Zetaproteobacteria bacterium CG_4_9_14_3_um_filter_49_83]